MGEQTERGVNGQSGPHCSATLLLLLFELHHWLLRAPHAPSMPPLVVCALASAIALHVGDGRCGSAERRGARRTPLNRRPTATSCRPRRSIGLLQFMCLCTDLAREQQRRLASNTGRSARDHGHLAGQSSLLLRGCCCGGEGRPSGPELGLRAHGQGRCAAHEGRQEGHGGQRWRWVRVCEQPARRRAQWPTSQTISTVASITSKNVGESIRSCAHINE